MSEIISVCQHGQKELLHLADVIFSHILLPITEKSHVDTIHL